MKPLRAYLFARDPQGAWACSPFRELEPLLDALSKLAPGEGAAIHVGFWRPETATVAALTDQSPGALLASQGAAAAFPIDAGVKLSAQALGICDRMPFHVVVSGLGRCVPEPAAAAPARVPEQGIGSEATHKSFRGWVADLVATNEKVKADLMAAGIWDDDSYFMLEQRLPRDMRFRLGLARFRAFTRSEPNNDNVIANLRACPPWFMALPLNRLDMTVRQANVMKTHQLHTVADLAPLGVTGLLNLPSLGRGSVHGLGTLLYHALISEERLAPFDVSLGGADEHEIGGMEIDDSEPWNAPATPSPESQPVAEWTSESFLSGLLETMCQLHDIQQLVLRERMGFRCDPQTLQQIAGKLGVTRERVRQIEHKAYIRLRIKPLWGELRARVSALLQGRASPLLLGGMEALDPWFKGSAGLENTLREISRHLLSKQIGVFEVAGATAVSNIWEADWDDLKSAARAMLVANASDNLDETRARAMVEGLLVGKGEELREDLWAIASEGAIWIEAPGKVRQLAGFRGSAEELVLAVLRAAGAPLEVAEIHRRIIAMGHTQRSEHSIRNASQNVAMLYARGVYGLAKHCPLDASQLATIRAEVDDIMGGGDTAKQWHTSELFDALIERGFDFDGALTKYLINIALRGSPHLSYLRRMVWRHKSSTEANNASARLDLLQAVIALVEAEGRPMTTAAIREKLLAERGVNATFQIHPEPPLLRIGPGTWGLLGRDASIDAAMPIIDKLKARLAELQRGIHVTEFARELNLPQFESELETHKLVALARTSGIRIDRSQYVYPEEWSSSRRVFISDAVSRALDESAPYGASLDYICKRVEELILRKVPRVLVSQLLQHTDARWDPLSGVWRAGLADDAAEPDEDDAHPTLSPDTALGAAGDAN